MPLSEKRIILDLCGGTGAWSKPWADAGYDVRNITLPKYDVLTGYIVWRGEEKIDYLWFAEKIKKNYMPYEVFIPIKDIYGLLAAPPCQMFSFARTKAKAPRDLELGMKLVEKCLNIIWQLQSRLKSSQQKYPPLKFWALENPYYGMLRWFLGKPAFVFDPWEFGDPYQKKTALWGHFNEPVKMKNPPMPRPSWSSKKFDRLKSNEIHPEFFGKYNRQVRRAITPAGFAKAFYEANK